MGTTQFGTPAQQPAAAPVWVPYLNLQQGLRMDYPNTWTTQEQGSPFSFAAWFGSPQQGPQDSFQENVTLTVQPVFAGTTLDTLIQGWQAVAGQAGLQVYESGLSTAAGKHAFRSLFQTPPQPPGGQPNRVLLFLFLLDTRAFTFAYTGQSSDFDQFLPIAQQMLATLQVH
jgi:eukaryotic-like serine/threonine-protein kinase